MRRRILSASAAGHSGRVAALLLGLAAVVPPAAAADYTGPAPLADAGVCADAGVLSSIRHRFAYGAARVEQRDLALVAVEAIHEVHVSVGRPSPIPRRWCEAKVTLSDGSRSTLTWVITYGAGFAGPGLAYIPDDVEFCVAGHDPWRVHDGNCRTTRLYW